MSPEEKKQKQERITRRAELREQYGDDPMPDGEIIRWYKVFSVDDNNQPDFVYPYIAIHANERYLIGGNPHKVDWLDLLIEIETDNLIDDPVEQLEIADSWYLAFQPEE